MILLLNQIWNRIESWKSHLTVLNSAENARGLKREEKQRCSRTWLSSTHGETFIFLFSSLPRRTSMCLLLFLCDVFSPSNTQRTVKLVAWATFLPSFFTDCRVCFIIEVREGEKTWTRIAVLYLSASHRQIFFSLVRRSPSLDAIASIKQRLLSFPSLSILN